jgi:hypothetical protein
MGLLEYVTRLIESKTPADYTCLVKEGFTTQQEIGNLQAALSDDSKVKYNKGVIAQFESKTLENMLYDERLLQEIQDIRNFNSGGKIHPAIADIFARAKQENKPHIPLTLLFPKFSLGINIPYDELERLSQDFIANSACGNFVLGLCLKDCHYGMKWDKNYCCAFPYGIVYKLLSVYSGTRNSQRPDESLRVIMENTR